MKVLVLSHLYPGKNRPAFGVFVHCQVKALIKIGYDVTVISPVFWSPRILGFLRKRWRNYGSAPEKDMFEGVRVYYPRFLVFPKAWLKHLYGYTYYFSVRRLIKKNFLTFDMIHAHTALPDGFSGLLLKKTYPVPLVTTIHGVSVYLLAKKNRRCRKAVTKVLRESDAIVAVSSSVKKLVYQYSGRKKNVFVVGNGVPLREIQKLTSAERAESLRNKKLILSVGALMKQKGHEYVLRALPQVLKVVPNLMCLLIGEGRERKNLETLAGSLDLLDYVKFLGCLPHRQTLEYMSTCDVFVLPSWNEAFGVVYIEAMAFGKPVIGCKREGLEDFVKDGQTGILVNAQDEEGLKNALIEMLVDEKLAGKIGEEGKRLVETHYTWESNAEKIAEIYKRSATYSTN